MTRLSLRARITAAFLTLIVMALVETGIVLYVQRESSAAFDETLRTQQILLDEAKIRAALLTMQTTVSGFVFMIGDNELAVYREQRAEYEQLIGSMAGLIHDREQAARFNRAVALAASWQEAAERIIADTEAGRDSSTTITTVALPRFAQLEQELSAFVERQQTLSLTAVAVARRRIQNATIILTAIPVLAVVFMFGLLVASWQTLRPLRRLVVSAMRLARGDYGAPLPRTGQHEIGALVSAFAHMRTAVEERATDAAAARRRAQEAHAELLGVLNTTPSGIVVLEPGGSIRLQNRAANDIVGLEDAEGAGAAAAWASLIVRDSSGRVMQFENFPIIRALRGADVIGEQLDVERPDGRRLNLLVSASPFRDEQGRVTGAVAGFHDITRLRELDRLKDEFVAIVSHELRTPLTAIRGALQLLLAENAAPSAEHQELLTVASNSCERLVRIVNNMLDLSKIEAGRLQLQLAPQSVEALVRQAAAGVQALAVSAAVRIEVDVADGLPVLHADGDRMTQALVNLLSNAIKFAPPGSAVTIRARLVEGAIAISVADRGPGIATADLSRLFQKFQQLDNAGTRRTGGTGLGLVITKGIVEEHGGAIAVESVVGEGTTFTVTVPIRADASRSGAAALAGSEDTVPSVLIVDDRDATRAPIEQAVRAAGLRPVVSAGGPAALEASRREHPAVILVSFSAADADGQSVEELSYDAAMRHISLIVSFDDRAAGAPTTAAIESRATELADQVKRLLDNRPHGTILVADDDPDARFVLRKVLERQGFRVVEAVDGADVLERTARDAFDLLVLDLRMPRLHGHDVIRALRANAATATLPIIVLSGSSSERQSLHALVLGANAFLTKPAAPDVLVDEIRRLVHREPPA